MKVSLLHVGSFIFFVIGFFLYLYTIILHKFPNQEEKSIHQLYDDANRYSIAIVTPDLAPSSESIIDGFQDLLFKKSLLCKYNIFNGSNDRTLIRSQIEDICTSSYDLIYAIGSTCSKLAVEITQKRAKQIPIVFGAVGDPVGLGIVHSLEAPMNNVTGVTVAGMEHDLKVMVNLLLLLIPHLDAVVLVGDPTQNGGKIEAQIRDMQEYLHSHGVRCSVVYVYTPTRVKEKVLPFLAGSQCIITLNDVTIMSCLQTLVLLANNYKIPLYAYDIDAVVAGAAVGFGFSWGAVGKESALLAYQVLHKKHQASSLPIVTMITPKKVFINKAACTQQGLHITEEVAALCKGQHYLEEERGNVSKVLPLSSCCG